DSCKDFGESFDRSYVPEGELAVLKCPIYHEFGSTCHEDTDNLDPIWYKNDSERIIPERGSRLQTNKESLWFFPVRQEDSGSYTCVMRNSTDCIKQSVILFVHKADPDLCMNKHKYGVTLIKNVDEKQDEKLVCPDLGDTYWLQKMPSLQWYKECQLIETDDIKYWNVGELLIRDMTKDDEGNYTCEMNVMYEGKPFKMTRTIDIYVKAEMSFAILEVIYPTNNTIEAKLGKLSINYSIPCHVLSRSSALAEVTVFWLRNVKFVQSGHYKQKWAYYVCNVTTDLEQNLHTNQLRICEVKKKDFGKIFQCIAFGERGAVASAYFILKPLAPSYKTCIVGTFTALSFIIMMIVLIYKIFKVDIVLWYRNSCPRLRKTEVLDGKIFDAYVIYSKHNCIAETFVMQILPHVLEKKCGYKLFIYGRDVLPGQAIAEMVDETIRRSTRLIVILTPSTNIKDDFESQIGMHNILIHNQIKAILIEYGKIKDYTYLPESIQYIKEKQGTIKWKGDNTEKSLSPNLRFWKNVRYQMPHR
uniref:Interleukin-1 receptor type 1 n=1 Tax=Latimeria chalumnae TaxID=7897 RepID=H2ZXM6_LATCH